MRHPDAFYDSTADVLTVVRHFEPIHTSTTRTHDDPVVLLRDEDGYVTGVVVYRARTITVDEWEFAARASDLPRDLIDCVAQWLRGRIPQWW